MIYLAKFICFVFRWLYRFFIGPCVLPFLFFVFILNLVVVISDNISEYSQKDKRKPRYSWDFSLCATILFAMVLLRMDLADKYA